MGKPQEAADLVQPGWLEHVDALASSLRQESQGLGFRV